MDLRELFGEGTIVTISDVWKEYQRITGTEISVESEETESERIDDSLPTSGDAQTSADQTLVESEKTESEPDSDSSTKIDDSQASLRSNSSSQAQRKCDWIENTSKWNYPMHLALHLANSSFSSEWRKACQLLNRIDSQLEWTKIPVPAEWYNDPLFTTLVIKPSRAGLRKLKHAIRQPVQPPFLREVLFDCQAIRTREDVENLGNCRESLIEILGMLYDQTGDSVQPLRDALILLLEAFLCAIGTKQEVRYCWNVEDPNVCQRSFGMACHCRLLYQGIGPSAHDVTKFMVYFDIGLDIGEWTVAESGEKTVQEVWLCIFQDECEFELGRLLINGWPGTKQQGLDYNLVAFEAMLMTTDMRRIEFRNTKLHVGGLLSLLDRNKNSLDILVLEQVDTDDSPEAWFDLFGWIADTLTLDYLRIQECRCKGHAYSQLFDTEIREEDGNFMEKPIRREASMSMTDWLRHRFLQLEPSESAPRLSIPKEPLCLW
jgi:hypothetical protein